MADHMTEALIRDLLPAHKKALEQLQAIDRYIADLNNRILRTCLAGNYGHGHHLTLRSSVAMGMRRVYKRIEERKWRQVLEAARQVLDEDAMAELESGQSNHERRVTTVDQTASQWSIFFNESHRHN